MTSAGLADDEQRAGLSKGQLDFSGGGLGDGGPRTSLVSARPGRSLRRERSSEEHEEGGEINLADFLGFEGFPGVDHFFFRAARLVASCAAWSPESSRKTMALFPAATGLPASPAGVDGNRRPR